jgi:carotenoid cleavage dioxygenase
VIDAGAVEFPRHRGSLTGAPYRFGYATSPNEGAEWHSLKYDLVTGERTAYSHGDGRGAGEPVFVSRPDASAEDDGWLVMFVHDQNPGSTSAAELVVLDAQELSRGPVARVLLPQRIPFGFHGNWVRDTSVPDPNG